MSERRLENRYLCADLIRVDWLEGEDEFHAVKGVLEDICAVGGCVQVEAPIPVGSVIMLSIGRNRGAHFTGCVCYCEFREYGYFVGVRFSDENVWTEAAVSPGHLFDPQSLTIHAE
jgi:hypothetical protein